MNIADILQQKEAIVYSTSPDATVFDAIQVLCDKRVGCLLVFDEKHNIAGVISERDVLRKCGAEGHDPRNKKVKEIMTPKENIIIARKVDDIQYAMNIMTSNRIRHLPVVDQGEVVGLLSIGDLVKAILKKSKYEREMLEDYISGKYPR